MIKRSDYNVFAGGKHRYLQKSANEVAKWKNVW